MKARRDNRTITVTGYTPADYDDDPDMGAYVIGQCPSITITVSYEDDGGRRLPKALILDHIILPAIERALNQED